MLFMREKNLALTASVPHVHFFEIFGSFHDSGTKLPKIYCNIQFPKHDTHITISLFQPVSTSFMKLMLRIGISFLHIVKMNRN